MHFRTPCWLWHLHSHNLGLKVIAGSSCYSLTLDWTLQVYGLLDDVVSKPEFLVKLTRAQQVKNLENGQLKESAIPRWHIDSLHADWWEVPEDRKSSANPELDDDDLEYQKLVSSRRSLSITGAQLSQGWLKASGKVHCCTNILMMQLPGCAHLGSLKLGEHASKT